MFGTGGSPEYSKVKFEVNMMFIALWLESTSVKQGMALSETDVGLLCYVAVYKSQWLGAGGSGYRDLASPSLLLVVVCLS